MGNETQKLCAVCLVEHDDEIHAATLDVMGWFRDQVTQGFAMYEEVVPEAEILLPVSA